MFSGKRYTSPIQIAYVQVFCFVFFKSSGGWVNIKLKLPHFHVSDTCRMLTVVQAWCDNRVPRPAQMRLFQLASAYCTCIYVIPVLRRSLGRSYRALAVARAGRHGTMRHFSPAVPCTPPTSSPDPRRKPEPKRPSNSTRVYEGRKGSSHPAMKMQGTNRSGGGARRGACYVIPDLNYE